MKKALLHTILLIVISIWSCQKEITGDDIMPENYLLKMSFINVVGVEKMQLGSTYQNPFNEPYTITSFKYYVSNVVLQNNDEPPLAIPGFYHLVNEADLSSQSFTLPLNKNTFNKISFLIGVDSTRNVSGTQTGALDPTRGMFWTWNSGYIMAKLEATSPLSTAPANKVELHVGGFRTGENALRTVVLNLPPTSPLNIKTGSTSEVMVNADANAWFNAVHSMKIEAFPVSTSPGDVSMKYADNYAKMFTVTAVHN